MHAALRVVGIGRTVPSVLPNICPLAHLVTCPLLRPTSVPGTRQQLQTFSRGGGASCKSGKEKEGVTVPGEFQKPDELRKEIGEIEKKQWTMTELRKEIKKAEILTCAFITEKARKLEIIENQLAMREYNFNVKDYKISKEENKLLIELYNLNAKVVKKEFSNYKLKTQLKLLKEAVNEHERRVTILNGQVKNLQNLGTDGVKAICLLLKKPIKKSQENFLSGWKEENLEDNNKSGKDGRPRDSEKLIKNLTELEIRHLKDELRHQKEILLERIEYYNNKIMEKTALLDKITSFGNVLLEIHSKGNIRETKLKFENDLRRWEKEEVNLHKELNVEKEKLKRVRNELSNVVNRLEEFDVCNLCKDYSKQSK